MKTVFFLLALAALANSAGIGTLGPPQYLYMCTYAINNYEGYEANEDRSAAHSNEFASDMRARMAQYMPAVGVAHFDSAREREANLSRLGLRSGYCEMVQFSGHGYPNSYIMWGSATPGTAPIYAQPRQQAFGGWTRWVLLHTCQSLKRGASGLSDNSPSGYKYWFGGAHAVLGFRSNTYWFYQSNCGVFGCSRYRSEYMYDSFATYWAPGFSTIWESWHMAWRDRIHSRGFDGSPAIVFMTQNIGGGTIVSGRDEQSDLQYNGDFSAINYSGAPTSNLYRTYIDYGTPSYTPLSPPSD